MAQKSKKKTSFTDVQLFVVVVCCWWTQHAWTFEWISRADKMIVITAEFLISLSGLISSKMSKWVLIHEFKKNPFWFIISIFFSSFIWLLPRVNMCAEPTKWFLLNFRRQWTNTRVICKLFYQQIIICQGTRLLMFIISRSNADQTLLAKFQTQIWWSQ